MHGRCELTSTCLIKLRQSWTHIHLPQEAPALRSIAKSVIASKWIQDPYCPLTATCGLCEGILQILQLLRKDPAKSLPTRLCLHSAPSQAVILFLFVQPNGEFPEDVLAFNGKQGMRCCNVPGYIYVESSASRLLSRWQLPLMPGFSRSGVASEDCFLR
jgi:hypothetical protein